jgi:hypothetical protein
MQNPGSDAGVFVWEDGGRNSASARIGLQRKAEGKARLSLLCTALAEYTIV